MKHVAVTAMLLAVLLVSGCGDLSKKAKEQVKEMIKEEVQKEVQKLREEANRKIDDVAEQADKQLDGVKTEIGVVKEKAREWLDYVKLALCVLGAITLIKLIGRPLARVFAVILLKNRSPSPRRVMPIQTKEEDPDETRSEPV